MAINKNALIRYKTIDRCLQNHYRKWTLEDLIQACSDALYEYENKSAQVSKRTIQLDIQLMRGEQLGYHAPIIVYDKKYYKYAQKDYSIMRIPLTGNDMNVLSEAVEMLKQFKDFSLFKELNGIIQRLEDKVYRGKDNQNTIIHLDKNEALKGLEHLDVLYQSILKKVGVKIRYQSFKSSNKTEFLLHPYILKEYNNRWFLVGRNELNQQLLTLALDRIVKIDFDFSLPYNNHDFNGDEYYKNTIGVTVLSDQQLKIVKLKLDASNAPYVLSKPFHHSQELIKKNEDNSVEIKIKVHLNLELERLILGFGNSIEVLAPQSLRNRIKNKLQRAAQFYSDI